MPYNYITRTTSDLSKGIDKRSGENAIEAGFSEDLLNIDTNSNGLISKRAGYEGHYGYLPLRVNSLTRSSTSLTITFDSSIDTSNLTGTPIVMYGKTSAAIGSYDTTDSATYFNTFSLGVLLSLSAGTSTETVTEAVHGVDTYAPLMAFHKQSDAGSQSNSLVLTDSLDINSAGSSDVDIGYITGVEVPGYLVIKDKTTTAGSSYGSTTTTSDGTVGSTRTLTWSSATHGLTGKYIISKLYYDTGSSEWAEFLPDSISISASNTITAVLTISAGGAIQSGTSILAVLSAVDASQSTSLNVAAGSSDTVVISSIDTNFPIVAVYTSGVTRELVIPDSVVVDSSAETMTIGLTNSSSTTKGFEIYYEFTSLGGSSIIVTDADTGAASETTPQLTVWGIKHTADLYSTEVGSEGHVTHIDSYRTDSEERVIAGLGGTLFGAYTRAEAGASTYLIPSYEVDMEIDVDGSKFIAPCFAITGASTTRSRNHIYGDGITSDGAIISAVEYVSAGIAKYTISLTNKSGTFESGSISITSGLEDYLTVVGMGNTINNGTFRITARSDTDDSITVANSLMTLANGEYDETGTKGRGQIYTDQIICSSEPELIEGDILSSTGFLSIIPTVKVGEVHGGSKTLVVQGVTGEIYIPDGLAIYATRTSSILPMSTSMTYFVQGDMLTLTGYARSPRITKINNNSDIEITGITGNGTSATLTAASAHGLVVGDKLIVVRTGGVDYDGVHTVTGVSTTTTLTFTSLSTTTVSDGRIRGKTIQLDESLSFSDSASSPTTATVTGRWIPIESPTSTDDLVTNRHENYLNSNDYNNQSTLRSVMSSDNMYFTNNDDEVMKFDGTNMYRAGLPRWQPQLFITTTSSGGLIHNPREIATTGSSVTGGYVIVDAGLESTFQVGDKVIYYDAAPAVTYHTVTEVGSSAGGTSGYIYLDGTIPTWGAGDLIRGRTSHSYYFRLNMLDFNSNIIASAVTGSGDYIVHADQVSVNVNMKLLGFPAFDLYDHDRIEIEIYRARQNTVAPHYRVGVVPVSFNQGSGYISFVDTMDDSLLLNLDPVNTALFGSELGTGLTHPLRAKYITSINNRLILANVTDYPQLDLQLYPDESSDGIGASDLSGQILLFRRDAGDSGTTTNNTDRMSYEFMTSGEVTIDPSADIAKNDTTFTITENGHGLSAGDWVYLFHTAVADDNTLTYNGWWQISSKNTNDFTVLSNAGVVAAATDVDRYITATAPADIPVWIGTDGGMEAIFNFDLDNEVNFMYRLANAINASQRMTDMTIETDFTPWMTAQAGNEIGAGRVVIRQEVVDSTTLAVLTDKGAQDSYWYVNGIKSKGYSDLNDNSVAKVYGSRVIVSLPNYPELFDKPYGETGSGGAIDVNPADGQEITGVMPFFSTAVFGTGQNEDVLVVFKENSIYLIDAATGGVTKLETRGIGCKAPHSIASSRGGIVFATDSGIYRLNRNQTITYVGKNIERLWEDTVNRDQLSAITGHHYAFGKKYKISVPIVNSDVSSSGNLVNSDVYVYDHEREVLGDSLDTLGAWSRYDNHPATGWCNLGDDAFLSSTAGEVFKVRNVGDSSDFRDDASGISCDAVIAAESFGNPGMRKIVSSIVSHFQMRYSPMTNTTIYTSPDLTGTFTSSGEIDLSQSGKIGFARSSPSQRRLNYIQLRYTNSAIDESMILTGIDYHVALLNPKGVRENT